MWYLPLHLWRGPGALGEAILQRREFITLPGGAATWPMTARAQQAGPVRRIGWLSTTAKEAEPSLSRLNAFKRALADLGWIESRNVPQCAKFEPRGVG